MTDQPSLAQAPSLSVVVASRRERSLLVSTISSLRSQCHRLGADLIVAREEAYGDLEDLRRQFPDVHFIAAPLGSSIPVVRGIGLAAARGQLVAVTEDHCVADERWLEELTAHAGPDADVVGGAMDNAQRRRAIEWGAFFSEYGLYSSIRDRQPGDASQLTAANIMYSRHVIADVATWAQAGEWENVVHDRLAARGARMRYVPSATMRQNQTYTFFGFTNDRFKHGYAYARKRVAGRPFHTRVSLALATPVLPFLFLVRIARAAAPSRVRAFVRALPLTAAFLTAWAAGEAVGYLSSTRGQSNAP